MRRKPKQLDDEPSLYRPASGGAGLVRSGGEHRRRRGAHGGGGTAPGTTDEPAELIALSELGAVDRAETTARARARVIARRLELARPPQDSRSRRGAGELRSVRYLGGSDELDLDATVEALAANPVPSDDDIVVRERVRPARTVVLVVDVSGSMRGERVQTAAATVGALAGELVRDRLAVVAFWSDAAVLVRPGESVDPMTVLDLLVRVPTQGLTNVSFALEVAAHQLDGVDPRDAGVLLLSDCVHNAGPDPRLAAGRPPRLDVLCDTAGECDVELARDLARVGRGRCRLVPGYRDVAGALMALYA
ncbi:MAG: VWA domain-containing protein [Mycobacteriaceae bacterium]